VSTTTVIYCNGHAADTGRLHGQKYNQDYAMNNINPKKLLHSKWTAVRPTRKEKHFMVTGVEFDEEGNVCECELEAVISSRSRSIDWTILTDTTSWLQGWK
jgi:tryptophan-rich hypothetical protein